MKKITYIRKKVSIFLKKNKVLLIFLFLLIAMVVIGVLYYNGLFPNKQKIENIIKKFSTDNYSLPYFVAERYMIWLNMRSFFVTLNYALGLSGAIASLMTVFYASTKEDDDKAKNRSQNIIFLSLLATCFTFINFFVMPSKQASMMQHAWRELDTCIIQTINDSTLEAEEKNNIIIDKICEIEKYIEYNEIL